MKNHEWFNKQTKADQQRYNDMFQEYKRTFKIGVATLTTEGIKETEVIEIPEEIEDAIVIPLEDMTVEDLRKYEEYKRKRNEKVLERFEGGR